MVAASKHFELLDEADKLREERDALVQIVREMLVHIDDGPRDCYGTRRDGTDVWKGSFLSHVEKLRRITAKYEK